MSRNIIQIATAACHVNDEGERDHALYALADDGSVWLMDNPRPTGKWGAMPLLPQGILPQWTPPSTNDDA